MQEIQQTPKPPTYSRAKKAAEPFLAFPDALTSPNKTSTAGHIPHCHPNVSHNRTLGLVS